MNLSHIFDPLLPIKDSDVIYGRPNAFFQNISQLCESKDLAGFLTPIWRPKVESNRHCEKERAGLTHLVKNRLKVTCTNVMTQGFSHELRNLSMILC